MLTIYHDNTQIALVGLDFSMQSSKDANTYIRNLIQNRDDTALMFITDNPGRCRDTMLSK